ncbi:hypothetical protein [Xanthobacter sp. ZOL 2024]
MSTIAAEIERLASFGLGYREIARRLDGRSTVGSVAVTLSRLRKEGRIPPVMRWPKMRFDLPPDVAVLLEADAEERGLSPQVLGSRILECVINGDLVNAVLDDGFTAGE